MNFIHEYDDLDVSIYELSYYQSIMPKEISVEFSKEARDFLFHRYKKDFVVDYILTRLKSVGSAVTFFGSFECFSEAFIYQSYEDIERDAAVITIDLLKQNETELKSALNFYCDGLASTFYLDDGEA